MNTTTKFAALAMGLAMAIAGASGASAATTWQTHHPRRVEINARLMTQNHRITAARREGELSARKAHELRTEDRGVRAQERLDGARHHGHVTRVEKRQLNRAENGVGRQIGR